MKELLRLYAGHFIEKESQDSWAVAARDKLRAKFVRAVAALGTDFEQRKEWDQVGGALLASAGTGQSRRRVYIGG